MNASWTRRPRETLLRRLNRRVRFTKGEWFYPMDSEPYVSSGSWVRHPGEEAVCVVPAGHLALERLAQQPLDSAGAVHYLKIPPPKKGQKRGLWTRLPPRRAWPRRS